MSKRVPYSSSKYYRTDFLIGGYEFRLDTNDRIRKIVLKKIKLPPTSARPLSDRSFLELVTEELRDCVLQARDIVAEEERQTAAKKRQRPPGDLKTRVILVVQPVFPVSGSRTTVRPLATIWGDGEAWVKGRRVARGQKRS